MAQSLRPAYDDAAYALDRADRALTNDDLDSVVDHTVDALDAVKDVGYPHLFGTMHEIATDIVLRANPADDVSDPLRQHLRGQLDSMSYSLEEMHALGLAGTGMFSDARHEAGVTVTDSD
jgi:hypothetical protein